MEENWPKDKPYFYEPSRSSKKIMIVKCNGNLEEEFLRYALNFHESAHIITKHILEIGRIRELDIYFFSLAYLYRHSLELILKAIGFKYIMELDDRKKFVKDTFHNLSNILETITPYIMSEIAKDNNAYNWIKSLFKDTNKTDKESDSFRYPFTISIQNKNTWLGISKEFIIKEFFEKQTHINLVTFASKMEIAFDILKSYYYESKSIKNDYKDYKPIFIEEGGAYYGQSVVGYSYNKDKFYAYVEAYTDTADYLYKIMKDNSAQQEKLFIPMCYLYRNGVELALKQILFEECSYTFQNSAKILNDKKHSILGLWNSIKFEVEEHANAPKEDTTIYNVEQYIKLIHDIDGTSDKFRYPSNKYLELHFKKSVRINVENISNVFSDLITFLKSVDGMMSDQNQWRAEYLSYVDDNDYDDYNDYE